MKKSLFLLSLLLLSHPLWAQESAVLIKWDRLLFGVFGGMSVFLYGMSKLSNGMKRAAGDNLRTILTKLTNHRLIGLLMGALVTVIVQSSTATTVMLVSFVQAGLITFAQTLGMILGADIGTTVTTQLIAFKVTEYALLFVTIGYTIQLLTKDEQRKNIGDSILGFGLLFFGMKLMIDSMDPLRHYPAFMEMMASLTNPVYGILLGLTITALIHSSAATIGLVIVLGQQNLINLNAAIPVMMGANIGTCVTAMLASIGTDRDAKRVAIAHILFKIGGVLLFIFWIPTFTTIVLKLSESLGAGSSLPRQIANAHSIFNIALAVVFLPFTPFFAKTILKFFPDKMQSGAFVLKTKHIDATVLHVPSLAMDLARAEILRMTKILDRMIKSSIIPFTNLSDSNTADTQYPELTLIDGIMLREQKIDFIKGKIEDYLIQIGKNTSSKDDVSTIYALMSIANDIESISDVIEKQMIPLIHKKKRVHIEFSPEGKEELLIYHVKVCKQMSRLKDALSDFNITKAENIIHKVEDYLDLETKYRLSHLERVRAQRAESLSTHEIHMELMDILKHINVYSGNIAKTLVTSGLERISHR